MISWREDWRRACLNRRVGGRAADKATRHTRQWPNVCRCHIKRKGRGSASTVAAAELAAVAGTAVGARRHGSMAAHEQGDGW